MKNIKTGVYEYDGEIRNFNFVTDLTAYEKTVFVRTIVETLIDEYNYDSILRNIIFDYIIITTFTDIDTSFLKIVNDNGNVVADIDLVEQFLLETNIVDIVKANAFPTLFEQLENAVDLSIRYRTGIHPSPINDALASLLSTLEKKINEVDLDSMMGMAQKFAGMIGELTPDSIMNAYMNSDIHKKNLEEIAESKKDKKNKKSKKNEIKIDENLGEAIRAVIKENKAENDSKN